MKITRRFLVALLAVAALALPATPAFADSHPVPPDGGVSGGSTGVAPEPGFHHEGQRIITNGSEARALVPGTTSTLEIIFANRRESAVRDAVATAYPNDADTLTAQTARIGDVAAGATGVARFEITLAKDSCSDFYGFGGEVTSPDLAEPAFFKAGFPVACPGARLSIESVTIGGGDGDTVAEPGELVTVTVVLRNDGADPARGVTAAMTVKGDDVEVVTGSARWPDIASGESAATIAPFTMRIASDAKTQPGCTGGPEPGIVIDPAVVEPGVIEPDGGAGSTEPGVAGGDTPVSSDGTVSSEKPASDDPAPPDGTSSSNGSGSIEPMPATDQPMPAPDGGEPAPMPMPVDRPGSGGIPPMYEEDPGVAFEALFEVITTSGERFRLDYSTRMVCMMSEGSPNAPALARDDASAAGAAKTGAASSDPAFPIAAGLLTIVAGLLARRGLALRRTQT